MSEHLVERVITTVEREVGHVNLFARIELARVIANAIDEAVWNDWKRRRDYGEETDEP